MTTFTDAVIDLETYGTRPDAPIKAIGIYLFNAVTGDQGELLDDTVITKVDNTFERIQRAGGLNLRVDLIGTPKGLTGTLDVATFEWWLKQTPEAQQALLEIPNFPLLDVMITVASFLRVNSHITRFWGNGPSFDNVLLRSAFERVGIAYPLSFRTDRCVRTIVDIAATITSEDPFANVPAVGIKHSAFADAVREAAVIIESFRLLDGVKV